jgi:hypothetical protein
MKPWTNNASSSGSRSGSPSRRPGQRQCLSLAFAAWVHFSALPTTSKPLNAAHANIITLSSGLPLLHHASEQPAVGNVNVGTAAQGSEPLTASPARPQSWNVGSAVPQGEVPGTHGGPTMSKSQSGKAVETQTSADGAPQGEAIEAGVSTRTPAQGTVVPPAGSIRVPWGPGASPGLRELPEELKETLEGGLGETMGPHSLNRSPGGDEGRGPGDPSANRRRLRDWHGAASLGLPPRRLPLPLDLISVQVCPAHLGAGSTCCASTEEEGE